MRQLNNRIAKGRSCGPFWMNFQKTSKRPLTALVSENYVTLFFGGTKICNKIFRIEVTPPFSENSSFFPLKITRKICNFFWMGKSPPLGSFPKIHPNLWSKSSLTRVCSWRRPCRGLQLQGWRGSSWWESTSAGVRGRSRAPACFQGWRRQGWPRMLLSRWCPPHSIGSKRTTCP